MPLDTVNFPNFKPRSHHEVENVVPESLPANKTGSKLSSPLSKILKSSLRRFNCAKPIRSNEDILDVYNTALLRTLRELRS